jgi:hypothetical protein
MPDSPLGIDKRQIIKSRRYMTIEGKKDRDKIFTLRPLLNRCFYVPEPKQKRAMGRMEDEEQPGLVLLPEGRNWQGTREVERRGRCVGRWEGMSTSAISLRSISVERDKVIGSKK